MALRCCGARDKRGTAHSSTSKTLLSKEIKTKGSWMKAASITAHRNTNKPWLPVSFAGCIWQKLPCKGLGESIEKALSPQKDKYTTELARWWLPLLNFMEKHNLYKPNSPANLFPLVEILNKNNFSFYVCASRTNSSVKELQWSQQGYIRDEDMNLTYYILCPYVLTTKLHRLWTNRIPKPGQSSFCTHSIAICTFVFLLTL